MPSHNPASFSRIKVRSKADNYRHMEKQLGKALALFADDNGITSAALARELGTSRQHANSILHGNSMSLKTLLRFCVALNLQTTVVLERS